MSASLVAVVTDTNFEQEVTHSGVPVLLDFWAPWCGPCKTLGPTIEQLAVEFEGRAKMAKVNIDDNPKTASKFNIRSIPTILLFSGGNVESDISSIRTLPALTRFIEGLLAGQSRKDVLETNSDDAEIRAMLLFSSDIETIRAALREQPQLALLPLNGGIHPLSYAIRNGLSELKAELLLCNPEKTFYDLAAGGFVKELTMRVAAGNFAELMRASDNLESPLAGAVRNRHFQCIDVLLDGGADPNIFVAGHNVTLEAALQSRDVAVCGYMAERGLNFRADVVKGFDALRFVLAHDPSCEIVSFLLEQGVDPLRKNAEGHSSLILARQLAEENPDAVDVVELLESRFKTSGEKH